MLKKIFSFVLVMCLVLMCGSLTACNEDIYSIINDAVEKTDDLDSMDAEMKIQMDIATEGMTLSMPVTVDMKAKGLNSDSPILSSDLSMTMLGQTMEMQMYQEGDWAYLVIDEMKYKTSIAEAESEYDYSDDIDAMLQEIPENLLKDVKAVKNDDGSQTVTINISDKQFAEIYDDFIEDVNSSSGTDVADIKISDAVVSITVADGYISVYDIKFKMEMEIEGMKATADVKASVTYKNPGKDVTVTAPEGYKDFEELDLSGIEEK